MLTGMMKATDATPDNRPQASFNEATGQESSTAISTNEELRRRLLAYWEQEENRRNFFISMLRVRQEDRGAA
jgi:hypothetical protein